MGFHPGEQEVEDAAEQAREEELRETVRGHTQRRTARRCTSAWGASTFSSFAVRIRPPVSSGQGATGVTITEIVPDHTTFNAAASTSGWSCLDASPAGTTCTQSVTSLAAGASNSVTFAVSVVDPLPAGVNQISNNASIADDGAITSALLYFRESDGVFLAHVADHLHTGQDYRDLLFR